MLVGNKSDKAQKYRKRQKRMQLPLTLLNLAHLNPSDASVLAATYGIPYVETDCTIGEGMLLLSADAYQI